MELLFKITFAFLNSIPHLASYEHDHCIGGKMNRPLRKMVMEIFYKFYRPRQLSKCFGFFLLLLFFTVNQISAKNPKYLCDTALRQAFYLKVGPGLFWFQEGINGNNLRQQLLAMIGHSEDLGLEKEKYHFEYLYSALPAGMDTSGHLTELDQYYTDAALFFLKDVLCGDKSQIQLAYDELSKEVVKQDELFIVKLLADVQNSRCLDSIIENIEPKSSEYLILKMELKKALISEQADSIYWLKKALNTYRWQHHFQFERFISVNIPSGTLRYYTGDTLRLEMKVVTGKPSTPTPRFATHCNEVILYPYWNVPRSIAIKEFLPLLKHNPSMLKWLNVDVIDKKGSIVKGTSVRWSSLKAINFPYRFRQPTGCDNALGVIKFNLTSPFAIYFHDTNFKSAFKYNKRFLSHGCIRLEKPIELAELLIEDSLDKGYLTSCLRNQIPVTKTLPNPVPVFILYQRAEVDSGRLVFYENVYGIN